MGRYKNNDDVFSNKKNNFAILHLAALDQKSSQENPLLANEINFKLTKKILKMAIKYNYKKIIFFSSVHIYGKQKSKIKETNIPKPTTVYGKTKKKSEEVLLKYSKNIDIIIFRISNVIAKPINENVQSQNLLVNFLCKNLIKKNINLNSNGLDVRDFISIQYLISCVKFFLENKKVGVYNICSGKVVKIKDITLKILNKINKKIKKKLKRKVNFGTKKMDKYDFNYSNNKIIKLIKFKKKHDIFEEIDRIINYYN